MGRKDLKKSNSRGKRKPGEGSVLETRLGSESRDGDNRQATGSQDWHEGVGWGQEEEPGSSHLLS